MKLCEICALGDFREGVVAELPVSILDVLNERATQIAVCELLGVVLALLWQNNVGHVIDTIW